MNLRLFGTLIVFALICIVTLAPVFFVLIGSFDVSRPGQSFSFGLDGWIAAFSNPKTLDSIGYSFLLSIRIPIAILVAFPIAWILARERVPFGDWIEKSLWFSFFLPTIPLTMGWVLLLDENYGLLNQICVAIPFIQKPLFSIYSVPGIIWVHLTASTIPIMVILLKPAISQIDSSYEEAARIAGTGTVKTVWRVTIPLLMPAILTSFIAGLIRSLEVYEIEQLLGTPKNIQVYSTRIVDLINQQPPALSQAMALSSLFLFILFFLAALYQLYLNKIGARATLTGKGVRLQKKATALGRIASVFLLAYVIVSIVLPLSLLVMGSFKELFGYFDSAWTLSNWELVLTDRIFHKSAWFSLSMSLGVAIFSCSVYAGIAWLLQRSRAPGRDLVSILIWLPWGIPGVVMGLALLTIVIEVTPLRMLSGSVLPIVFALALKDMPFGVQMISTAVRQVSREMEEASVTCGAGFVLTFRRIVFPLIAPTIISVLLLVFAASMRDISTITLLSGPGLRTMALVMFEYATSGKFEAAAVIGIILAVFSLIITLVMFKVNDAISIKQ